MGRCIWRFLRYEYRLFRGSVHMIIVVGRMWMWASIPTEAANDHAIYQRKDHKSEDISKPRSVEGHMSFFSDGGAFAVGGVLAYMLL